MNDNLSYNPATTDPNYQPGIPPQWNPPTTPPKKKQWFKNPLLLIPLGALLLGLSIGGATAKTETVEVIKEVKVPGPERTVTKNVEVPTPVTPASCLEALTLNEEAFDLAVGALDAISQRDMVTANSYTAKLQALAPKVNAAKAQCRAN